MKTLTIFLMILMIFGLVVDMIWFFWWYPKTYEYSLRLADDASLPDVKAKYLTEYLEKINIITGQPAYIFMRPDLELNRQRELLRGLIQRFEDIAKIDPSNMAYQQGMMQLTGQEMDHQLNRISGIFKSAKLRENPFLFFIICWLWLITGLPLSIYGIKKINEYYEY